MEPTEMDAGDVVEFGDVVAPSPWQPVNIDAALLQAGSAPLLIGPSGSLVFDVDSKAFHIKGQMMSVPFPGVEITYVAQPAPFPELAVVSATSMRVQAGVVLHVIGTRAVVFAASGDIDIEGILHVGGGVEPGIVHTSRAAGGPGGYSCCNTSKTDHLGPGAPLLGRTGGAGHLTVGGNGGGSNQFGGSTAGTPPLVPLLGGSAGGSTVGGSNGGGGGGAVQLAALGTVRIAAGGGIDAGAAGGSTEYNGNRWGGGGGGGAILLDAPQVEVLGTLAANGGGGATKLGSNAIGQRGQFGLAIALGGKDGMTAEGGAGGAADVPPTNGKNEAGGGGSAGRIRLRSWMPTVDAAAIISPSLASGGLVVDTLPR